MRGPPRERPCCKSRPLTEGNTMHNPKPDPSTMRPTAPPGPQNPKYSLDETKEIRFITRLDTDKPGLYVVKLATVLLKERKKSLFQELHKKINVFAPGSELIILPSYVEAVESHQETEEKFCNWLPEKFPNPNEIEALYDTDCGLLRATYNSIYMQYCPRCGNKILIHKIEPEPSDAWINERIGKKKTIGFPVWQSMATAPEDRYILTHYSGMYAVLRWNSNISDWMTEDGSCYKASEWMELPK